MKTLLILRHAKSSWSAPLEEVPDHRRGLNSRGKNAAQRMGRLISSLGLRPSLVIGSNAERVMQTVQLMLPAWDYEADVYFTKRLYLRGASAYREELGELAAGRVPTSAAAQPEVVLLVGHNPDLEEFLLDLSGRDERLPTAALAILRCEVESWAAFASQPLPRFQAQFADKIHLVEMYRPRDLPGE